MTSVLNAIVKLPRYVRLLSTNGKDEQTATIIFDKQVQDRYVRQRESQHRYYERNRLRYSNYNKRYYQQHKHELNKKSRKRYLERKNAIQVS